VLNVLTLFGFCVHKPYDDGSLKTRKCGCGVTKFIRFTRTGSRVNQCQSTDIMDFVKVLSPLFKVRLTFADIEKSFQQEALTEAVALIWIN